MFGSPAFYKTSHRSTFIQLSTTAVELWLSVPRSLRVWLFRITPFILFFISYIVKKIYFVKG
jgi:hypothetical protein